MQIFGALKNMFRRADKAAAEAMANPVGDAEIAIEDAEREIGTITKAIASYMAEKKKIEREMPKYSADIKKCQKAAEDSLAAGREDLAKEALLRKNESKTMVDDSKKRLTIMEKDVTKMRSKLEKYKKQVRDAKVSHKKLAATASMNDARSKLSDASSKFDSKSNSFSALSKLEDQVKTQEAEMDAMDELTSDPMDELEDIMQDSSVDSELEALKAKVGK